MVLYAGWFVSNARHQRFMSPPRRQKFATDYRRVLTPSVITSPPPVHTVNTALAIAGYGITPGSAEAYAAGAWTATANLNTGRYAHAGAGQIASALTVGGTDQAGAADILPTELFNSMTWSNSGNIITPRWGLYGCGFQSAALNMGGSNNGGFNYNNVEKFDGGTWAAQAGMLSTRQFPAACGIATAALVATGGIATALLNTSEKFDGTSWTAGPNLLAQRGQAAGCGTQTAMLVIGGWLTYQGADSQTTEIGNGISWMAGPNLLAASTRLRAAIGTTTDAFSFGGYAGVRTTERYAGIAWATDSQMNVARWGHTGAG